MKKLSTDEMKHIKGGFNHNCGAVHDECLLVVSSSGYGACCSGLTCSADSSLGNNAGWCTNAIIVS